MKYIAKKLVYSFVLVLLIMSSSNAQYQLNNRLIQKNKLGINVAYAGELNKTRMSLVIGVNPNKIEDANTLNWQQATLDLPLANKLSTATIFTKIATGSFSQIQIKQAFAYKVDFSEEQTLSVGFGLSYNQQNVDLKNGFSPNDYVDLDDPYLSLENYHQNKLGLEIGFVYQLKDFQLSVSLPSLGQDKPYNNEFTAYTEYKFKLNKDLDLIPSVLFVQTQNGKYELTNSLNLDYQKKGWLQVGYVDIGQVVMGFGINVKGLGIGYNFGYNVDNNISSIFGNTHQFGLFFNL
ncbi:type IX secretion system membrane protein, PorP/SprF family [Flavobacterium segetis]|uniref:Type IX secretion system membrane protein, PorP/SprF family n=1 Tax=Flavobacterium segetis TaxID=271157 RepID=A0A1M5JS69_9FLAO|nr:PorP/SprF family type IX secretion system membrane protein [Flavobacterium segetis]SHG43140.1 type IX secretion system membrane protein, PorP/SprF family [Flavobacterium segetis]